jgi:FkbM family methyltransferase
MGLLTIAAKVVYQLLPESRLKKELTAVAFRALYKGKIRDYRYKKGVFTLSMNDGMEIRSVKDFDPVPLLENFVHARLKKGASVMDLGGNLGIVSVYLSKRTGKQGKVYVFEPDEKNFNLLSQNVVLNKADNVTPVKKGVWNRNGTLEFFSGGNYTSSFHKTDYIEKGKSKYAVKKVTVTTMDNAAKDLKIKKLDLVKIDIEGSEIQALEGGEKTIRKFKPDLIVEAHIIGGKSTAAGVHEILKQYGYGKIVTYGPKRTPTIYAKYK